MIQKAQSIINKYNDLSKKILSPEILNDHTKLIALSKKQSDIEILYKKCSDAKVIEVGPKCL